MSEQKAEMKHNKYLQSAVEFVPRKVTDPRGIDADCDSSIEDWGIEFRPAVFISIDENEDAISLMHDVMVNDHDIEATRKTESGKTIEEKEEYKDVQ